VQLLSPVLRNEENVVILVRAHAWGSADGECDAVMSRAADSNDTHTCVCVCVCVRARADSPGGAKQEMFKQQTA
jgi:hypothetical protein